jgi:hypothetical protein
MRIQRNDANECVRFQLPCAALIHDDAEGLSLLTRLARQRQLSVEASP